MINGLKDVRRIVTHKNCPDGIASALICHDALPDASVEFVMYGEESYEQLRADHHMLFVDIIPPADRADEFVEAAAIVLDHHKHAREVVDKFGERGRFADETDNPGVSGALLAYDHVWCPINRGKRNNATKVEHFANVTGVRDTWQINDPRWDEACAQAEALLLYGYDELANGRPWLDSMQLRTGYALMNRRRNGAKSAAERAHIVGKFAFTNERYASDFAEALREMKSPAEVGVAFSYIGQADGSIQIIYSLRTIQGDTDVGAIAKANGGGGHTKAAGFKVDQWEGVDPIALFLGRVM